MLQFDFSCEYSLEEVISLSFLRLSFIFKLIIMPKHYNLRSVKRKRNELLICKALSPSVQLTRLEVLESPKNWNSTFYVKESKILLKKKSLNELVKVRHFIVLLGVCFIISSSIFLKDEAKDLIVKGKKNYHSFQLRLKKFIDSIFNRFLFKKKDVIENQKNFCTIKNNTFDILKEHKKIESDCKVKEIIETEVFDLLNGANTRQERTESFIEEECKKEHLPYTLNNLNTVSIYATADNLADFSDLADYALQSRGAQVLSVFDTEPYGDVILKYLDFIMNHFFVHKLFNSNGPTSVLVPWTKPGDCWAFKGTSGRILISLSEKIKITAISIDHISKDLMESGSVESAPKKFSVAGIAERDSSKKTPFGTFEYDISGPNLQTFRINSNLNHHFNLVEVSFYSNHGNKNYTCVYKIRVHGYT